MVRGNSKFPPTSASQTMMVLAAWGVRRKILVCFVSLAELSRIPGHMAFECATGKPLFLGNANFC